MSLPTPSDDSIAQSRRAIARYEHDRRIRMKRRAKIAQETGYMMFAPGMF